MRRRNGPSAARAFSSWLDFAKSYAEMSGAAAQVIAHRSLRMAQAGARPSARDRREFALMGREKVDAAAHSALAIGSELWRLNCRSATQSWLAMLAASADLMSLGASRTPSEIIARQAKLARTLHRSAPTMAALSGATASLTRAALKPVHVRARRNAARLRRR